MLLGAAGVVGVLAHRFRLSTVLGFLLIGLAIGPNGLGRLVGEVPALSFLLLHEASVHLAAELGVAFLLFMIGLELSLDRLWRMRALVFGLGGAQVAVTGALIAVTVWLSGHDGAAALVLGAALALSSTAIVMQVLAEGGRLGTPVGRAAFGVLVFQDLAVVPILFVVGILGAQEGGGPAALVLGVAGAMVRAAFAILLIMVAGRLLLRPLLRIIADTGSHEAFLAAVLLAVLGTAAATEAAGLSLALGAFLAGLLLSETEFRHRVEVDLGPFKGLLLGVFFVSVGLGLDLAAILEEPLWLPLSVLGLVALKALVLLALLRISGESAAVSVETAVLLAQGGEFAFIVLALAQGNGLVPPETARFMALVAGLSMAATPFLAMLARRLGRRLEVPEVAARPGPAEAELAEHVIIAGYGRVGRAVGEILDARHIPHVAVDADSARVRRLREQGVTPFFGDAAQAEMLALLGAGRAAALVVTMDRPSTALEVVRAARAAWPRLPIHVRVHDEAHGRALLEAGASAVSPEVTEASLQLGEGLLTALGVPEAAAHAAIAERRDAVRRVLL